MRVAVTGATGFIGGHIVRRLVDDGHEVLALGRRTHRPPMPDGMGYATWDLGSGQPPPDDLARCDAVVHVAAHVADWGPRSAFRAVTIEGTGRLLEGVAPDARVVLIGTASVYDPQRPHPCAREDEAPVERYMNEYGRAKAEQERLTRRKRPDAVVLRPHAVYGPGDRTLLPRLLAARRRGGLVLPAGGRHPMSVTHVDTVADAVLAALREPTIAGPVNVADATPVTPAALLSEMFGAMGRPTRIRSVPPRVAWVVASAAERAWRVAGASRPPPVTRYAVSHLAGPFVLDLTRLHSELRIRPDRSYRELLPEVANWSL